MGWPMAKHHLLGVIALSVQLAAKTPSQRLMRMEPADISTSVPAHSMLALNGSQDWFIFKNRVSKERGDSIKERLHHFAGKDVSYQEHYKGHGLDVSCRSYLAESLLQISASAPTELSEDDPTQDAFEHIYNGHVWGGDGRTSSLSGAGSSWGASRELCSTLQQAALRVLAKKKAAGQDQTLKILDAPSGDWFWMPTCLSQIEAAMPPEAFISYQGVDIAPTAVAMAEKKRTSGKADFKFSKTEVAPFRVVNLADAEELLNEFGSHAFDIVMSHDALQHNPTANVHKMLQNFNKVGAHSLVVDVDRGGANERDIGVGDVRFVDITRAPYCFKPACGDHNPGAGGESPENEWFAVFELPLAKGGCESPAPTIE